MKRFRVWDKQEKEWCEKSCWLLHDGTLMQQVIDMKLEADPDRFVVCFYTGLKDKNDVEICDKDILIEYSFVAKVVVHCEFYEGAFILSVRDIKGGNYGLQSQDSLEIIGNILENPELMEVKL